MLNWLFCLLGRHNWGNPENIRESEPGIEMLILPIAFLYAYLGRPKVCDIKCKDCGKVKTEPYQS
jgi:hypothetical protein